MSAGSSVGVTLVAVSLSAELCVFEELDPEPEQPEQERTRAPNRKSAVILWGGG